MRALRARCPERGHRLPRRHRARALRHPLARDRRPLRARLRARAHRPRRQGHRRRLQHRERGRARHAARRARSAGARRHPPGRARRRGRRRAAAPSACSRTTGTIASGAYPRAVAALTTRTEVVGQAAPLFVSLAEEGWTEGEVPRLVARRYLEPVVAGGRARASSSAARTTRSSADAIEAEAAALAGAPVAVVDSAHADRRRGRRPSSRERGQAAAREPSAARSTSSSPTCRRASRPSPLVFWVNKSPTSAVRVRRCRRRASRSRKSISDADARSAMLQNASDALRPFASRARRLRLRARRRQQRLLRVRRLWRSELGQLGDGSRGRRRRDRGANRRLDVVIDGRNHRDGGWRRCRWFRRDGADDGDLERRQQLGDVELEHGSADVQHPLRHLSDVRGRSVHQPGRGSDACGLPERRRLRRTRERTVRVQFHGPVQASDGRVVRDGRRLRERLLHRPMPGRVPFGVQGQHALQPLHGRQLRAEVLSVTTAPQPTPATATNAVMKLSIRLAARASAAAIASPARSVRGRRSRT